MSEGDKEVTQRMMTVGAFTTSSNGRTLEDPSPGKAGAKEPTRQASRWLHRMCQACPAALLCSDLGGQHVADVELNDTLSHRLGHMMERQWDCPKSRTPTSMHNKHRLRGSLLKSLKHLRKLCFHLPRKGGWRLTPDTRAWAEASKTYLRTKSVLLSKRHSLHFYLTALQNWL